MAPTPAPVPGPHTFIATAASMASNCGLRDDGWLLCWGYQEETWSGVPRLIAGLPPLVTLDLGEPFGCGLTADGAAWCWSIDDDAVARAAVGLRFRAIAHSQDNACGITIEHAVYCWESGGPGTPVRILRAP